MPTDPSAATARRAIALVDLTELGDHATDADVTSLCARAVGPHGTVAAVCVWPRHVALAARLLAGSGVRIATVVNFPGGDDHIDPVVELARSAQADGADEIDLVLPYRAFLAGRADDASAMVTAVRGAVEAGEGRTLKVILETGELVDPAVIGAAAELAIRNGADFIKTSTGKTPVSATLADAAAHLAQADRIMGPGWATSATFRFGASGLLTALEAAVAGDTTARSTAAY